MTRPEAIKWLQAILDDTLERDDERDAKRIEAIELTIEVLRSQRRPRRRGDSSRTVSGPREAYGHVRYLARQRKEHLVGLYLDAQNCLIVRETISIGTLNTTRTHPREILHPAIVNHALGFILAHNHPSGSLTPSQDDADFTKAIRRAAELMGVGLYDHLIIGRSGFVSLKEKGLL
jgi:DNA repair protein RadC